MDQDNPIDEDFTIEAQLGACQVLRAYAERLYCFKVASAGRRQYCARYGAQPIRANHLRHRIDLPWCY